MRIKYLEAALDQDIQFFDTEVRTSDVVGETRALQAYSSALRTAQKLGYRALGQSAPSMAAFTNARVAATKKFRVIDHKPGIDKKSESGLELETITGLVELKNVDFSYPSRPEVWILNNFSLNVPSGKTIALVGKLRLQQEHSCVPY